MSKHYSLTNNYKQVHISAFWLCIMLNLLIITKAKADDHGKSSKQKQDYASENTDTFNIFYNDDSSNFVIRWAFQDLCDHVFDPRHVWPTPAKPGKHATFDPEKVKAGDMIFVRDAHYFFKTIAHKITEPYFILTSGEYLDMFKKAHFKYLENEQILAWFTIHPHEIQHERVFPLPLGVVQYQDVYEKRHDMSKQFLKMRQKKKDKLLYMNNTDWNMPERRKIRDIFKNCSFCHIGERCPFNKYIRDVAAHKFVISPPGLGPDCYRVWESLLVGTIPIVQHSYLDYLYDELPVLFIDNWEEVTVEFLEQKYQEITSRKYDARKLFMEYWIDYINAIRSRFNKSFFQ